MALLKPYCTLEQVQRETKDSDSSLDDTYTECINLASRWIDERTGRDFWSHDHSTTPLQVRREDVFEDAIMLPFPILTLTEVKSYALDGSGAEEHVIGDECYWENVGQMGRIMSVEGNWPDSTWGVGRGGYITLKGTFGYTTTSTAAPPSDHPSGIARACTLIAAAWSVALKKQEVGLDGGVTDILDTSIPAEARALLKKYTDYARTTF